MKMLAWFIQRFKCTPGCTEKNSVKQTGQENSSVRPSSQLWEGRQQGAVQTAGSVTVGSFKVMLDWMEWARGVCRNPNRNREGPENHTRCFSQHRQDQLHLLLTTSSASLVPEKTCSNEKHAISHLGMLPLFTSESYLCMNSVTSANFHQFPKSHLSALEVKN